MDTNCQGSIFTLRVSYRRPLMFSMISIFVFLATVNGQPQTDGSIQYSVFEEEPANTSLGNIVIDSALDTKYEGEELRGVYFTILEHTEQLHEFFYIDAFGDLRTSQPLDRESICPFQESCYIKLDIQVQPLQYFQIIKVSVLLDDINDNEPVFPDEEVFLFLPESSSPGTTLAIPLAVDSDSPKYGIQRYQLLTQTDKFELLGYTSDAEAEDLTIGLKESLDREKEDRYMLSIVCFDGGDPGHTGYVTVNITVSDINDNPPVFETQRYYVNIAENFRSNTKISQVRALDEDEGLNGQVFYEFSRRTSELFGNLFSINGETGEIFVTGTIDYEKASSYLLSVVAKDRSTSSLTAMATINIQVQDLNDNAPDIRVNILTGNESFVVIPESLNEPRAVVHLSVRDPDEGASGRFTCRLNNINFRLQQLYTTEFMVEAVGSFDREESAEFNLEILCDDTGSPALSTLTRIKVKVIDSNDSPPVFKQDIYHATIIENNQVGAFLLEVGATDGDEGENAELVYDIIGPSVELFAIDQTTGNITVKSSLDREIINEINITVIATDKGEPPLTGSALVTVHIQDQDDSLPVFMDNFSFEVEENQAGGSNVGAVQAIDPDEFHNQNDANYSIISQTNIPFTIEPNTGQIYTTKPLDREENRVYSFDVLASSNSSVSRAIVNVFVKDKNDNAPVILFPSLLNHTVVLSPKAERGHTVTKIIAIDLDDGVNSLLTYKLKASENEQYFSIESETGEIFLNADVHEMKGQRIQLMVRVSDLGTPPLKAEALLKISLNGSLTEGTNPQKSTDADSDQTVVIAVAATCGLLAVLTLIVLVVLCRRYCCKKKEEKKVRNLYGSASHDNLGYSIEGLEHTKKVLDTEATREEKEKIPSYENWSDDYLRTMDKTGKILGPGDSYPPKSSSGFGHLDKDSDSGCSADLSNGSNATDSGRGGGIQTSEPPKTKTGNVHVVPLELWREKIPEEDDEPVEYRTNSYVRSIQSAQCLGKNAASQGRPPVYRSARYPGHVESAPPARDRPSSVHTDSGVPYYINLDEVQVHKELFSDASAKPQKHDISGLLENWRIRKYTQSFNSGGNNTNYPSNIPHTNVSSNPTGQVEPGSSAGSTQSLQDTRIPTNTFYPGANVTNNKEQLDLASQHFRSLSYSGPNPYKEKLQLRPKRVIHEVHV